MNIATTLESRFDALSDLALWRGLAPSLHIGAPEMSERAGDALDFAPDHLDRIDAAVLREGYFEIPPLPWGIDVAGVADAISALVAARHMPVFIFMYDEPWLMFARLRRLLATVLDESYMMLPAFWAWRIDGQTEKAGWKPHSDLDVAQLLPDRRPKSVSLWIPLTDATLRNGCMYVLPADRDPSYGKERSADFRADLQSARAVPAAAGSVLGWTQALFHWGSRPASTPEPPRISMSVEFQRGDQLPMKEPLLDPEALPDPVSRLRLIFRQIVQFKHMYVVQPDLLALAERFAMPNEPPGAL